MRTSRRHIKQARRAVLTALLLSSSINVLMLAMPLYTLQVFDTVVPTGSVETLAVLTAMIAGAVFALALLELCRDRILLRAGLWLDHVLGQHILHNGLRSGSTAADLKADIKALATVRSFIVGPSLGPVLDAPWIPLFLVTLVVLHPLIGALATAAAACLIVLAVLHGLLTGRAHAEGGRAQEHSEQWWSVVASNAAMARALGLSHGASRHWERSNRQHIASSYAVGKRTSFARAVARTIRIAAQVGIYGLGAWLVIRSDLAPGALVASAILLARVLAPLEQLVGGLKGVQQAAAAYRRLKSLPPDAEAPALGKSETTASGRAIISNATAFHAGRKSPALRSVTLEVSPGECVALVGPCGAGKSTLAAVLAGALAPASGYATMDGVALAHWQAVDGSAPIGYLPDEPILLEGTVHQNIARFEDVSLMAVARTAMRAGVHEVLSDLPQGYDTPVGPGGTLLSSRERRAVALARTLHAAPRLVVLDEPEIGLDVVAIRRLLQTLRELKSEGVTVAMATQDRRLLAAADRIVLLTDGAIQSVTAAADLPQRVVPAHARTTGAAA